jgi:hypothetical protein
MDEITSLTDNMVKERMNISFNAHNLAWHFRGGIDYIDIMNMSHEEIDNLNRIIDSHMETTKKTKLPFF